MVVLRSSRIYSHSVVEDCRNSYEAKLRTHCVDPLHNSYGSSCINVSGFFGESDPGTSSEFLKYEIHRNSVIENEVFRLRKDVPLAQCDAIICITIVIQKKLQITPRTLQLF